LLPIAAVACEARDLACGYGTDLAQANLGDHTLEPSPQRGASGRYTKIIIDNLDLRPTQNCQPLAHGVLQTTALAIVYDLMS